MNFSFDSSFRKSFKRYDISQKIEIKRKLDIFIRAFETEKIPYGFGLKCLKKNLWEIRINLPQRTLFWKFHKEIIFTFVGNHDEVIRFLKHI